MKNIISKKIYLFLLSLLLIACGSSSGNGNAPAGGTGGKGSRTNPYSLGDEIVFSAVSLDDSKNATLKFGLNEFWDLKKLEAEYPSYNLNVKLGVRGTLEVVSGSTDEEIDLNVHPEFIDENMNEYPAYFNTYVPDTLNESLYTVYTEGKYEVVILTTEEGIVGKNLKYLKLNYTDTNKKQQSVWIDIANSTQSSAQSANAEAATPQTSSENNNEAKNEGSAESATATVSIKDGDILTITDGKNEIELTWNTVSFDDEVYNTSDNQFKQYFPDQEGETYLVAKMNVKNTGGDTVSDSFFDDYYRNIEVVFDGKYKYSLQQLDTTSMVMSKFWSVQPLKNLDINFVQLIPDEIIDKPYEITFTVGETTYSYLGNQ